jgi:hypothetical protein
VTVSTRKSLLKEGKLIVKDGKDFYREDYVDKLMKLAFTCESYKRGEIDEEETAKTS